jgi:60 kDa SS-A/Ro ribonucleoprotein
MITPKQLLARPYFYRRREMPNYASRLTNPTQQEPIFGKDQVKNDAGGYVFKIDPFDALDRFLVLGCETGTYYTGSCEMTQKSAAIILDCAKQDRQRTIHAILVACDTAIKQDPAVFALALLAGQVGDPISTMALEHVNYMCRFSTPLFSFVNQVTQFRGWGSALRKAVAGWYTSRDPMDLLYQVTKYQQRNGWSHRDLLRLSHPSSEKLNGVFKYIVGGGDRGFESLDDNAREYIGAVEAAKKATTESEVVGLINESNLVREHIPTVWLNSERIWEALLLRMPYTAMIRNLGKMTSIGLLSPMSDATKKVSMALQDTEALRLAQVHPFSLLLAQTTYAAGHGLRGNLSWTPDPHIVDALEDAFYSAFEYVEPAGKNFLLGIDVSGSMGFRGYSHMGSIAGTYIKAYQAAAVMAMAQIKTEPWCHSVAFSGSMRGRRSELLPLSLSKNMRLDAVIAEMVKMPVGPTDCALPMIYAAEQKLPVDVFVVYTDNETWCGKTHPARALEDYRQKMGRDAKMIACGMTATDYSVVDPDDPGMMDVVGFDASCPAAISKFASM